MSCYSWLTLTVFQLFEQSSILLTLNDSILFEPVTLSDKAAQ